MMRIGCVNFRLMEGCTVGLGAWGETHSVAVLKALSLRVLRIRLKVLYFFTFLALFW